MDTSWQNGHRLKNMGFKVWILETKSCQHEKKSSVKGVDGFQTHGADDGNKKGDVWKSEEFWEYHAKQEDLKHQDPDFEGLTQRTGSHCARMVCVDRLLGFSTTFITIFKNLTPIIPIRTIILSTTSQQRTCPQTTIVLCSRESSYPSNASFRNHLKILFNHRNRL
jgi:hypothetical protein